MFTPMKIISFKLAKSKPAKPVGWAAVSAIESKATVISEVEMSVVVSIPKMLIGKRSVSELQFFTHWSSIPLMIETSRNGSYIPGRLRLWFWN